MSYNHAHTPKLFHYMEQLNHKKLIFRSKNEGNVEICIKFVQSYSLEAHQHLANLQCAPAV